MPDVYVAINGVQYATDRLDSSKKAIYGTLIITDIVDETPTRAQCSFQGFIPTVGQELTVALGSNRIFAGPILSVEQTYLGVKDNYRCHVSAVDYTWLLNRRKVSKRYTAQSATAIAQDLISTYASGFTSTNVQASLDTIDEITFTEQDLTSALTQLAKRIGGYWYCDYFKDLHFFLSESGSNPATLTLTHDTLTFFLVSRDLSQIVTRAIVEGGGGNALTEVAVGETILPVTDASWYSATGGVVKSGPQRITYTGVVEGGTGGLVGPGAAPTAGPTLAQKAGAGVESGAHGYAVTYVTGAGESIPGPTESITVGTVAAPSSALTPASLSSGGSVNAGDHDYVVTFVTATGETTQGPASASVTAGGEAASPPSSAPTAGTPTAGGSVTDGNHYYAVTFESASGETAAGPSSNTITAGNPTAYVTPPTTPSASGSTSEFSTNNTGWVAGAQVNVKITYITASGETTASSASSAVTLEEISPGVTRAVRVTMPVSGDPAVTGKNVYFSLNGATYTKDTNSPFTAADTEMDNASQGATSPPSTNTAVSTYGRTVALSGIQTGPAGTTARKVYRTAAGGAQLKLLTTISNNTTTTFSDTVADASLGANVPTGATLNTVNITGIPLGNAPVTSRKLYRRFNATGTYKLLATIADNTTTTYTDTTANASLGADVPGSNTATANQVSLSAIPIGGTGVTQRKVYRTVAGGAQLKLLTTIADNTTTTYSDSTADASLGANVPTSDTSGLAQPEGQVAAGSTTCIVANTSGFASAGGWAVIGNGRQVIRYTGMTSSALTGIPASGVGSIVASIAYNSSITQAPALTGIAASGSGSILYVIPSGDSVNILITRNDTAAQTTLAALLSTCLGSSSDGIQEEFIQDRRLSQTECEDRGDALLALRSAIEVSIRYRTRDRLTRSGRTQSVSIGSPFSVTADFKIQQVVISNFRPVGDSDDVYPDFDATASSTRFSLEDLLRLARGSALSAAE